jgi:GT2 family glycosyltransferase|tara:strand:+ start:283 stop:777 length:495 start_codon:yes stop_codon:yes gene_type:complete
MAWGIGGVLLLLIFAIFRLAPMALELVNSSMSQLHWLALAFSVIYMAYAEGYKGFHLGFAPRVVVRARYLADNPRALHVLLAPLFCMGYIYATRKRQIVSFALTVMIICFVLIARSMPQPWRGILDAGVVVGLSLGVLSIAYFLIISSIDPARLTISAEVPDDS